MRRALLVRARPPYAAATLTREDTHHAPHSLLLGSLALTTVLSACVVQAPAPPAEGTPAANGSAPAAAGKITGPDSVPKVEETEKLEIAFFGFARANSFASATFTGIDRYAKQHNASATFFDSNFDGQKQASQIQDAVTSGRYKVFIVQANDGTAVMPAVKKAVEEGITVVVEFTPVGPRYDTREPQVPGTITMIDVPVDNGKVLGELGIQACEQAGAKPCKVAYFEGFKSLPLDNARTKAALDTLRANSDVVVLPTIEGGYTRDAGRKAMQDTLQANPDVNVVIGSTQAILGAEQVAQGKKIGFIGNGGSREAIDAVRDGRWFATYCFPEVTIGETVAAMGLAKARGAAIPESNASADITDNAAKCTKDTVQGVEGEYSE